MEFTANLSNVTGATNSVSVAVSNKIALPVLGNILIEAYPPSFFGEGYEGSGMVLLATNNFSMDMVRVIPANVIAPGTTTIPATTFKDYINTFDAKAYPTMYFSLEAISLTATVKIGKQVAQFKGISSSDFPASNIDPVAIGFDMAVLETVIAENTVPALKDSLLYNAVELIKTAKNMVKTDRENADRQYPVVSFSPSVLDRMVEATKFIMGSQDKPVLQATNITLRDSEEGWKIAFSTADSVVFCRKSEPVTIQPDAVTAIREGKQTGVVFADKMKLYLDQIKEDTTGKKLVKAISALTDDTTVIIQTDLLSKANNVIQALKPEGKPLVEMILRATGVERLGLRKVMFTYGTGKDYFFCSIAITEGAFPKTTFLTATPHTTKLHVAISELLPSVERATAVNLTIRLKALEEGFDENIAFADLSSANAVLTKSIDEIIPAPKYAYDKDNPEAVFEDGFQNGYLAIAAQAIEIGDRREIVPMQFAGNQEYVNLNGKLWLKGLQACKDFSDTAEMRLGIKNRIVLMMPKGDSSYEYWITPMHIKGQ